MQLLYTVDLLGTAVFASSGVLLAGRLKMDFFGALMLASAVAIGGGTLRDLILGATPVFWTQDNNYLWVILVTSIVAACLIKRPNRLPWYTVPFLDAIGLAAFVAIGVEKSTALGFSPVIAVIMGMLTGCGGGIIRDIFADTIPLVFRKEVYAFACIAGGIVHTGALYSDLISDQLAMLLGIITTLAIRLPAIYWHLSLPKLNLHDSHIRDD